MDYWHNPRCSKSREALALLTDKGLEPTVRLYLDTPPSAAELASLIAKLGLSSAREMMRTKEAVYKDLNLKSETDETALIEAMSNNPKLIERPILVVGDKAVIGRPPENVLNLIN